MRTAKDILIVILLLVLVTMTCLQEGDILGNKHRVYMAENELVVLDAKLAQLEDGLVSMKDGLELEHLLSCTATLWVMGPITIGCGVFVSDNVLLTAKHLVEDRDFTVVDSDGVKYTAIEILEDADDDLAVVVIEGRQGPWLEIGKSPALGDDVICIGTPISEQAQLIITWGRVSSEKWKNNFIYDGFVRPGCSGGPVIVDSKLVGIVEAYLPGPASLGFAAPIERLDPVLCARFQ